MSKTPNQVIQNLENVLASLKTKTGKNQNNLTDVVNDMADKPSRATTTIAATTTEKTNELKVSATNNQATGYVEGSSQDNNLTIGLSANGDTVSAKWGSTVVATQKVATVSRATTTIGTVANDTNDTLTITATNSQGTGYVVTDSGKNTASKIVTLGIATPTIDASGNVTAIATVQDNSATPVKVSKTSNTLALGIGSLSVNGNIVTTSAGYYSSATSATVATATRATTSLGSTVTNNKLVFTATNNQTTGYVVADTTKNNATATVSLSVNGKTVTASDGVNSISESVATVSRASISHNTVSNDNNDTLTITSTSTQDTGYVTGGTESATTIVTLNVNTPVLNESTGEVTAVASAEDNSASKKKVEKTSDKLGLGLSTLTKSGPTVTSTKGYTTGTTVTVGNGEYSASVTLTSGNGSATATGNISLTAATVQPSGYYIKAEGKGTVTGVGNASITTAGYLSATNKNSTTATATSNTATQFYSIPTGSYTATQTVAAASGTVSAALTSATGMTLGTAATTAPASGPYLTVSGSGKVSIGAVTATQSAGYIASLSSTQAATLINNQGEVGSNTATVYYPITPVTRADVQVTMKKKTESHDVDTIIITASNNQSAGYVAPDNDSTGNYKEATRVIQLKQVIDEITDDYGIFYGTEVNDITEEGNPIEITYVYENLDPYIRYTKWSESAAATSSNIEKNKVAFINGKVVYGSLEKASGSYYSAKPKGEDQAVINFHASDVPKRIVEGNLNFSVDKKEFGTAKAEEVKAGVTFTSENGLKLTGTAVDPPNLHVDYIKQSYLTPMSGTSYNDSKGYYTVAALKSCPSVLPAGWVQYNKAYVEECIEYDYPDTQNSSRFIMEMVNTDEHYFINVYIKLSLLYTDSYGQHTSTTYHKLTIPPNGTNSLSREFPGVGTFAKWSFEIDGYRLGVASSVM